MSKQAITSLCVSRFQRSARADSSLCSASLQTAPSGINPLEHEELPMSVQQVQQNVKPTLAAVPRKSTERHHGAFSQVNALPRSVFARPNDAVGLYRAHMDNRGVILRVLEGTVSCSRLSNWDTDVLDLILYKLPVSRETTTFKKLENDCWRRHIFVTYQIKHLWLNHMTLKTK